MIREFHLADLFTVANAACGVAAVFCAMNSSAASRWSISARGGAGPGRARVRRARRPHRALAAGASALGRELDSLADVISFGVAPAALAFAAGLHGRMGLVVLHLFRVLRRQPARALQRDRRIAFGGGAARSSTSKARPYRPACCSWPSSHSPRGRVASATTLGGAWTLGPGTCIRWCCCSRCPGTLMISKTLRIPSSSADLPSVRLAAEVALPWMVLRRGAGRDRFRTGLSLGFLQNTNSLNQFRATPCTPDATPRSTAHDRRLPSTDSQRAASTHASR